MRRTLLDVAIAALVMVCCGSAVARLIAQYGSAGPIGEWGSLAVGLAATALVAYRIGGRFRLLQFVLADFAIRFSMGVALRPASTDWSGIAGAAAVGLAAGGGVLIVRARRAPQM